MYSLTLECVLSQTLREEKSKLESTAAKMESKVKDLQVQLVDAQNVQRGAAAAVATTRDQAAAADASAEVHGSDVSLALAAKDAEITALRAQLAVKDEDALRCVRVLQGSFARMLQGSFAIGIGGYVLRKRRGIRSGVRALQGGG
jgi:hypothetical protein